MSDRVKSGVSPIRVVPCQARSVSGRVVPCQAAKPLPLKLRLSLSMHEPMLSLSLSMHEPMLSLSLSMHEPMLSLSMLVLDPNHPD